MKQSITIKINAWIICAVLLISNLATILIWQPWDQSAPNGRTIKITGSTTIEAEADQYTYNPYYQKEGSDKTAINAELSTLSSTIVAKLKEIGVADSAIKTNVNSYSYGPYYYDKKETESYTLQLTITIKDKNLAQKVQDYISTTSPSGSITPTILFSSDKQKQLESTARIEALADANKKAQASAKEIKAKIGKVISVTDISSIKSYPGPWMTATQEDTISSSSTPSSYSLQPGLNDYEFSIEVVYELH